MNEIKRYHVSDAGLSEGLSLGRITVVLVADFDRINAERDALQQRLNAADQRIDSAEDLLRRSQAVVDGTGWTDLERDIASFFKPAAAERDHQIPGTSGMRLNMLANQGE